MTADDAPLIAALEEQRRLGVLGTSVAEAIRHSERYLEPLAGRDVVLDLGSGAGVPGLVIAWRLPAVQVILLDARQRRTDQLRRLVGRLGIGDRVRVVCGLAEVAARAPDLAASMDAVVARSFGSPAAVLDAATPYLRRGGRLIVSEPPGPSARWPVELLQALGLEPTEIPVEGLFIADLAGFT